MRVLVCGDRRWNNYQLIHDTLAGVINESSPEGIECVIEGEARGADTQGRIAANQLGIPIHAFPAQWGTYGNSAGPIRNRKMLDEGKPDLVLAFHNDIEHSKGTAHMVNIARLRGVEVRIITEGKTL